MARMVPTVVDVLKPRGDVLDRASASARKLRRNAVLHRRQHPGSTLMLMRSGDVAVYARRDWWLSIRRSKVVDGRCTGCPCYSCRSSLSAIQDFLDRLQVSMATVLDLDEGGGSAAYLLLRARRCEEAAQMLDSFDFATMQEAETAVGDGADRFLDVVRDAEKAVADGAEQFLRDEPPVLARLRLAG